VTRLAVEAELSQNLASGRCGASLWGFGLNAGQHELGAVVWAIDGDVTGGTRRPTDDQRGCSHGKSGVGSSLPSTVWVRKVGFAGHSTSEVAITP
jgi:hypothetical protein